MKYHMLFMIIGIMQYSLSLNSMDHRIQDEISQKRKAWQTKLAAHKQRCEECTKVTSFVICQERQNLGIEFHVEMAKIVSSAGDLVSDQEKLNHMFPDSFFPHRKEIIQKMIQSGIHPDNIKYWYSQTPMKEAILFKDEDFKNFLVQHGAQIPQ